MKTRDILLVNDDGVHSLGLMILKKKMDELGKVVVVAPDTERSGTGKGISINPVGINETTLGDGTKAYAISGTPADACLLALLKILKNPPSLVVSGINLGLNLGIEDLFTSGTLGAALEAAFHEIPAIAISLGVDKLIDCGGDPRANVNPESLECCAELVKHIAEFILNNGMPKNVDLLSINVPDNLGLSTIEVTDLSRNVCMDVYAEKTGGYQMRRLTIKDYPHDKAGTDVHAVRENRHISITPIKLNFIHEKQGLKDLANLLNYKGYHCAL